MAKAAGEKLKTVKNIVIIGQCNPFRMFGVFIMLSFHKVMLRVDLNRIKKYCLIAFVLIKITNKKTPGFTNQRFLELNW
jgi:hypothetical protein